MAATVVQYEDERVRLAKAFPGFFYVFKVFQGSSRFFHVFQVFQRFSRLSTFLLQQETPEPRMLELTWFKFLILNVDLVSVCSIPYTPKLKLLKQLYDKRYLS